MEGDKLITLFFSCILVRDDELSYHSANPELVDDMLRLTLILLCSTFVCCVEYGRSIHCALALHKQQNRDIKFEKSIKLNTFHRTKLYYTRVYTHTNT
jgi:hypothetical protein